MTYRLDPLSAQMDRCQYNIRRTGMKLCKGILFLLFVCPVLHLNATHNRAGEILYKRIEPFTKVQNGMTVQVYTYLVTLIKYTDHGPNIADRCLSTIYFGDGDSAVVARIDGPVSPSCN